jgi:hypothetical protein
VKLNRFLGVWIDEILGICWHFVWWRNFAAGVWTPTIPKDELLFMCNEWNVNEMNASKMFEKDGAGVYFSLLLGCDVMHSAKDLDHFSISYL